MPGWSRSHRAPPRRQPPPRSPTSRPPAPPPPPRPPPPPPPVTVAREAHPVAITQLTRANIATTLAAPVKASDTNVKLGSISGLNPGDSMSVDGEARTVAGVGTAAGAATTLFSPAGAGDTNLKVSSITG